MLKQSHLTTLTLAAGVQLAPVPNHPSPRLFQNRTLHPLKESHPRKIYSRRESGDDLHKISLYGIDKYNDRDIEG